MKKILFILLLAVSIINIGFSQIVKKEISKEVLIGKVVKAFVKTAELSYSINTNNDTVYHIVYNDAQYTQIDEWKQIFFKGGAATLNDLYTTFKQAVDSPKGKEIAFTVGNYDVLCKTNKTFGSRYLTIAFTDTNKITGILNLDKGKIDDLFGIHKED